MSAEYKYNLLTQYDRHSKVSKNEKVLGIHTRVLHLAPARSSGFNVCPMASKGCEAACLNYAGFQYARKQDARVARTLMFMHDRTEFMMRLAKEIDNTRRWAEKHGMRCGIRLNGTSDIRWETIRDKNGLCIMDAFPDVCFYDYTKIANRRDLPPNYRLTFSRSEDNARACLIALRNGMNVAVVFAGRLPATWSNIPVIDGDLHDFRYDDPYPCIVGLKAKGTRGQADRSGFVVRG